VKRIYLAAWIFGIVLAICFIELIFVNKVTKEIYYHVYEIENSILNEDKNEALKLTQDLEKRWESDQKIFSSFMEHIKLEYISQAVIALKTYLQEDMKEESLIESGKIREYINTIRNGEIPYIYNLL
jgi:hypothetical protein